MHDPNGAPFLDFWAPVILLLACIASIAWTILSRRSMRQKVVYTLIFVLISLATLTTGHYYRFPGTTDIQNAASIAYPCLFIAQMALWIHIYKHRKTCPN